MASTSLGRLYVDLLMKTGSFETDAGRAAKIAERRAREIDRAFAGAMSNVKSNIIGVGVALIGINSFVSLAQKGFAGLIASIANADKVNELSARLGRSAEEISAIGYAAKQSGTDLESVGAAIPKLSKKIAAAADENSESAKLFRALGVEIKDSVTGEVKDALDVLPDLQDRFKSLTNDTEKQALAMELFGKSGAGMIEFLNLGADGMKALTDRAAELGITISGETAAGADAFNDKLSELRAVSEGLAAQVAAELLPKLIELVDWAVQFTADGSNAKNIADGLGVTFGFLGDTVRVVSEVFSTLGTTIGGMIAGADGLYNSLAGIATLDFSRMREGFSLANIGADAAYNAFFKGQDGAGKPLFGKSAPKAINTAGIDFSRGAPVSPGDKALEGRVSRYFGGSGAKSGGGRSGKSGLTEEQKRAKELEAAYTSLQARQLESIALFGKEGEAVQLRYDIEFGALKGISAAKADELIANAERLDQLRDESELQKNLDEITKQQDERYQDTIKNLQEEYDALGLSNEALRIRNELQRAGVTLDSERGQSIAEMVKSIESQAKVVEGLDAARGVAYDLFVDLPNGAADAWKNALAQIESLLLQWAAKGLVDKLFGEQGTNGSGTAGGGWLNSLFSAFSGSSSGSGGGGWMSAIAGIFGGGRADGGPVMGGKMYDVTERGLPELVTIRNRQLMIMPPGANGKVTPMRPGGGGGVTVYQTLNSTVPHTRRSAMQAQQEAAFNLRMATQRA